MVTSTPVPQCVADIDKHNLTDHTALLGSLWAWEDKLQDYIEEEQSEQKEKQELLPRAEEHQHLEGPMEEQGIWRPTQRGPTQAATLVDMPIKDVQMAQGLDKEHIMQDLGWTKYNNTTNPAMPRVLYIEENKTTVCKWVRYNLARPNLHIEGTMGYEQPLYWCDLHADPQANPSFNNSHAFRDNHLQIFEPTHK
jgi:hypothetical protein